MISNCPLLTFSCLFQIMKGPLQLRGEQIIRSHLTEEKSTVLGLVDLRGRDFLLSMQQCKADDEEGSDDESGQGIIRNIHDKVSLKSKDFIGIIF